MIAYIVAMEKEAACLLKHLESPRERIIAGRRTVLGRYRGEDALVVIAGIGKVNAAAGAALALAFSPRELRNFGVAGGFDPAMEVGGIYCVTRAVEYDFDLAELNGTAVGVHDERTTPYFECAPWDGYPEAVLGTGDRFSDAEDDLELLRALGITLRDMEGAAVAHVAETAGIPFRSLKCVSDVHGAGSMTGQYRDNLAFALERLSAALSPLY